MNIKSLLLGSAAALAVVSGAHAADAIVAAEPEPAEYVKVCDAFGTGYFYIPGTETCLKIGGYVQFNVGFDSEADRVWNASTEGQLEVSAKSDSEFGTINGVLKMRANVDSFGSYYDANNASNEGDFYLREAYLEVGGLKAGFFAGYFDQGIGENSTWADTSRFNAVSYTYSGDGFSAGIGLDEISDGVDALGIEAKLGATLGGVSATLIGAYDTDASDGAIKGILSAEVGPGTFDIAALWSSGVNVYTSDAEWAVGAAYSIKATEQLTIMPEFQYGEDFAGNESWFVGALASYKLADGLTGSVDVNYNNDESVSGYFRLKRSF